MSFSALNWAWDQICPSGVAKSVLVYLANCASQEGGDCYPAVPTIAAKVQHKEDTVRKALKALVTAGLLQVEERKAANGRQRSNLYRLPVVSIPTPPISGGYDSTQSESDWSPSWSKAERASDTPENVGVSFLRVSHDSPPEIEAETPPESGGNPSLETKKEESKEVASLRSVRAREPNVVDLLPDRVAAAAGVWNEVCAPAGFPEIREVSDARRKRLQRLMTTRFNEPQAWRLFCQDLAASDFLATGHFGIDWVIKPANLIKIAEGNYRNRVQKARPKPGGVSAMREKYGLRGLQPVIEPEPGDERIAL